MTYAYKMHHFGPWEDASYGSLNTPLQTFKMRFKYQQRVLNV